MSALGNLTESGCEVSASVSGAGVRSFGLCLRSRGPRLRPLFPEPGSEASASVSGAGGPRLSDPLFWSRQRGQFCITPSHVVTAMFSYRTLSPYDEIAEFGCGGGCVEVFLCFN